MNTEQMDKTTLRNTVRDHYGQVARRASSGCCAPTCCSTQADAPAGATTPAPTSRNVEEVSAALGYSPDATRAVPDGANLGLGCGNPLAIASLSPGQTVLDLGSGAGLDAFLASSAVGPTGRVIGVDMTPEMIDKARANLARGKYQNVEFRLGEIENLPAADGSVDVIISNCVVNLSPDKARVFKEAYRVLKPGGRLAISDILAIQTLPAEIRKDLELYAGCVAGASLVDEVTRDLKAAGFSNIRVTPKPESRQFIQECFPGRGIEDYIVSATLEAVKP